MALVVSRFSSLSGRPPARMALPPGRLRVRGDVLTRQLRLSLRASPGRVRRCRACPTWSAARGPVDQARRTPAVAGRAQSARDGCQSPAPRPRGWCATRGNVLPVDPSQGEPIRAWPHSHSPVRRPESRPAATPRVQARRNSAPAFARAFCWRTRAAAAGRGC